MGTATLDGRAQRGERTRSALVDAVLTLYHRGQVAPTAREIAEAAGVSLRTVFHHFDDLETLASEVVARQRAAIAEVYDGAPVAGDLATRIGGVVSERATVFEEVAPVRRAALLVRHRSPTIAKNLSVLERALRRQLADTFAAELADDDDLLEIVDALTGWEAWDRLRTTQGLSRTAAERALRTALDRLLS